MTVFTEVTQKVVPIGFSSLYQIAGEKIGSEVVSQELTRWTDSRAFSCLHIGL